MSGRVPRGGLSGFVLVVKAHVAPAVRFCAGLGKLVGGRDGCCAACLGRRGLPDCELLVGLEDEVDNLVDGGLVGCGDGWVSLEEDFAVKCLHHFCDELIRGCREFAVLSEAVD